MVECPNCGNETDDNFCGNCGTKIEKPNLCPKCNNELEEDNVFCPKCGERIKEIDKEDSEDSKEESADDSNDESEEDSTEEISDESEDDEETSKEDVISQDLPKKQNMKHCPYCDSEIEDDDEFCQECGKPINIDPESFDSIKVTLQPKKVIIFSIISIALTAIVSWLLVTLFSMIDVGFSSAAFFIALLVIVGVFASFKDYLNGGLVGIIAGLVIGLIATFIIEFVNGFSFSYDLFSGYAPVVFTIFGAVIGVISSKFLRDSIKNHIDVENLF